MKLTATELLPALTATSATLQKSGMMPILATFRLQTLDNGTLSITASDLKSEIIVTLETVDIKEPGARCINAEKLLKFCKIAGDHPIKIETLNETQCKLQARSRATVNTLSADEFPSMPENNDGGIRFSLDAAELNNRMSAIEHCLAKNDARYYLMGMLFNLEGGQLKLAASDGHRLGTSEMETEHEGNIRCIVSGKTVSNILRTLKTGQNQITINHGQIRIENGPVTMTSKTIDHNYPDLTKILNTNRETEMDINAGDLSAAIEAASLNSHEKHRGVRLNFSESGLEISAQNENGEDSVSQMEIDYNGEPIELGFCADYLTDALRQTDGMVSLSIPDNKSHVHLLPRDRSCELIVMPMRI